jgi:tRNA 2-thiocytidine biosynthesis protein TtcA
MTSETRLLKLIADADRQWSLLPPGETILIALSGGKDSLALLKLLSIKEIPMIGLHLHPPGHEPGEWESFAASLCDYHRLPADWLDTLDRNPCFVCARKRREALVRFADRMGLRRIALGHHRDDVAATLLLNLFFSREVSTMTPRRPLFGGRFELIRPLFLAPEELIIRYTRHLPLTRRECPYAAVSRRKRMRELIALIQSENPRTDVADNLFAALRRIRLDFLPYPPYMEEEKETR